MGRPRKTSDKMNQRIILASKKNPFLTPPENALEAPEGINENNGPFDECPNNSVPVLNDNPEAPLISEVQLPVLPVVNDENEVTDGRPTFTLGDEREVPVIDDGNECSNATGIQPNENEPDQSGANEPPAIGNVENEIYFRLPDNGREVANKPLEEVVAQWPGCKIVHGKPRHSQSQGSVERANTDIEDILSVHQRETKTTACARFLPLIQYRKNIRFHSGIERSPYVAMFGRDSENAYFTKEEVLSDDDEIQQKSAYEEEEKTLQEDNSTRYADLRLVSFMDSIESGVEKFPEFANQGNNDAYFQLGIVSPVLGVQKDEEQAEIDCLHDSIMIERHGAHSAQKNQICTN
ncbi:unnamed protein product, partial [Mesorhabditis belari]|uniref:Integrase catalytic domain-containing protein n=1 Tax=Mesorhabditis belari TaxID=2138241 RepID=A0AAF3ER60_9BILA